MLPLDISAAANIHSQALLESDQELQAVHNYLTRLDPAGQRFSTVLRDTIDQLLNGEVTGRYDWKTLFKTEKTHAGTLVEINLQREFRFDDGIDMDYRIAGIDVDCKYSQQFGSWMIPPEAVGHLCLLVWADDYTSRWSAGLLRIEEQWLNRGTNRDMKLTVKAEHRNKILWLSHQEALPENVLLHLPAATRDAILSSSSGQKRVNELFRQVQNRRIGRGVVRTVAQQSDYMARVREAQGRARTVLREEGVLIPGHYSSHQHVARALGAQVPRPGELVSFRVAQARPYHGDRPRIDLDGRTWVLADDDDPVETAPFLPKHTENDRT
ncbi:NaeI family type II restriction endonuclease [Streptomyces yangpuensis]|uniref:NaeI family type II restriction endonuclease n=1 Tax=Streptomyces yangpuensis TaxID=1648182 RepID=A0ABY5PVF0_9ACTN|nr:NaeI family type II restriction endonuclease [Streptomyces yangpuensis]UUY48004.1 NaeI family type II restriction endonuclease [Streptomyces yangpuensis]